MSEPLVVATNVTKVFGAGSSQIRALNDVSLSLNGGELTVLMGPSGSGKTTLLSVLGCMLTPTQGSIRLCGLSTERARAEELARIRRRHIGFVFQFFHLFPTLTAAENIQMALDVRGVRGAAAAAKTAEVLTTVGLSHKAKAFPRQLSGGEQQRVAIARAIVAEPSVVLADEPTAALDSVNGHAIMEILASIAKKSDRVVLVVTHDTRLTSFAERILHIEDGGLAQEEPPKTLDQPDLPLRLEFPEARPQKLSRV